MLLTAWLAAAPSSNTPACDRDDGSTPAIEACGVETLKAAEAELARYVRVAKTQARQTAASGRKRLAEGAAPFGRESQTVDAFAKAEVAWKAYREAECDAVFDNASGGSWAGYQSLGCSIALTRRHTHTIWEMWLTSPERGGAPLLPEPKMSSRG